MKNNIKSRTKFTAVAFAVVVCAQAAAAQTPNTAWYDADTTATTFTVSTADELAGLAVIVNDGEGIYQDERFFNKTISLAADIDLSAYGAGSAFNGGRGWVPIGKDWSCRFVGVFDGKGKTVSGLYINDSTLDYAGLFGMIGYDWDSDSAGVKNLGVLDVDITARRNVGGVAGMFNGAKIYMINSYSTGTIRGQHIIGGVIGISTLGGSIANCYSTAIISGNNYVGGVVGYLTSSSFVTDSYFTGVVSGDSTVGGVAGLVPAANIFNCYSTGTVNGNVYVGGVVGVAVGGGGVFNSYSTGAVNGDVDVGGVAGRVGLGSTVDNCYSISAVNGRVNVGGLAGFVFDSVGITNSAALNPDLTVSGMPQGAFGRVAGDIELSRPATMVDNVAFSGMIIPDTLLGNAEHQTELAGVDITVIEIHADGTIGGRFTSESGWTTENGKLPGLRGEAVQMPEHLILVSAQTPNVTLSGPATHSIEKGESLTLSVSASVSDGGILSCQWYRGVFANNNTIGTLIAGATNMSYDLPANETGTLGTYHYYAVVTNTLGGVNGDTTASAASSVVTVTVENSIAILSFVRVVPDKGPSEETAIVAPPTAQAGELTAGPNPVLKQAGTVNFFRRGKRISDGVLAIYDVSGNPVRKILVSDNSACEKSRRLIGSWDLTDAKGRPVSEGAYIVRGTVTCAGGRRERVSIVIGIAKP